MRVLRRRQRRFRLHQIRPCAALYDADRIGGLADGAAVASVTDRSGNGNTGSHGTEANQPTYQTGEINGRPVFQFAQAANQHWNVNGLAATLAGADKAASIFAVLRKTTNNTSDEIVAGSASGSATPLWRFQTSGAGVIVFQIRDDASTLLQPSGGSLDTNPMTLTLVTSGTAATVRRNGTAAFTAQNVNVGQTTINQVAIGITQDRAGSGVSNPLDGVIACLAVWGRALGDRELRRAERLIGRRRYGLVV